MGRYRVTLTVNYVVDITPENERADPRPPLQGDRAEAALARALWVLLAHRRELCWKLGISRTITEAKDYRVEVLPEPTEDEKKRAKRSWRKWLTFSEVGQGPEAEQAQQGNKMQDDGHTAP